MTPGELFDLDEAVQFGDPWHGLQRGFSGELPGGIVRARNSQPAFGDRYEIQISGAPAVTTSPAEAALGMTWLNYAVMAGWNHVLYDGIALGNRRWVWVDDANTPCLVELSISGAGMSVSAQRFGALDEPASPVYTASCSLSSPVESTTLEAYISDIDEHGRLAVVVWHSKSYLLGYRTQAVALIQLTGLLSAPTISAEMKASFDFGGDLPQKGTSQPVTIRDVDKPWWATNHSLAGGPQCFGPAMAPTEAAVLAGWYEGTTDYIETFQRPFSVPNISVLWEYICGGTVKNGVYQHVIARYLEHRMGTSDLPMPPHYTAGGFQWGDRPNPWWLSNLIEITGWYEIEVCGNTTRVPISVAWREHHGGPDPDNPPYPWEAVGKFTMGGYIFPGAVSWIDNPGCCSIPQAIYGAARFANRVFGCVLDPKRAMLIQAPTVGYDLSASSTPGASFPGATYNDRSGELAYDLTTEKLCFF